MISDDRWGIVYCPKHERFRRASRWERIEKCLHDNGVEYDFVQSESMGSVDRLVRMLINNGYKTIVIVGGDSALNDAVNCLMQVDKSVRDPKKWRVCRLRFMIAAMRPMFTQLRKYL